MSGTGKVQFLFVHINFLYTDGDMPVFVLNCLEK